MTSPTVTLPSAPAAPTAAGEEAALRAQQKKTAHLLHNTRLVANSYLLDGAVLGLFWLAGTIGWMPMVVYTACGVAISAIVGLLIASGWSQRFKDPSMAIAQTAAGQLLQLGSMLLVPEVGFMFALILFIVYTSVAMRFEVREALIAWALLSVCMGLVLALGDRPLRIPDDTLVEQLIALAFFALTLWRCVWLGAFNSDMTGRLKKRGRELAALTAQVDMLAHHDELTGLLNRRSLLAALREEQQRADRQKTPLCVALLDLDRFKTVNDTLGHLAGDKTLKIFADTLKRHTRASDRFGRYGGEEFLLIMTGASGDCASVPLERMREALKAADWHAVAPGFNMTFSCGIALYVPGDDTSETLLQRADEALYRAKADGRNCTRLG